VATAINCEQYALILSTSSDVCTYTALDLGLGLGLGLGCSFGLHASSSAVT